MSQYVERIPYYPNREEYEALARHHLQKEPIEGALPQGFPQQLTSVMVWEGQDISLDNRSNDGTKCVLLLDESQLKEIDTALRYFQSKSGTQRAAALVWLK